MSQSKECKAMEFKGDETYGSSIAVCLEQMNDLDDLITTLQIVREKYGNRPLSINDGDRTQPYYESFPIRIQKFIDSNNFTQEQLNEYLTSDPDSRNPSTYIHEQFLAHELKKPLVSITCKELLYYPEYIEQGIFVIK